MTSLSNHPTTAELQALYAAHHLHPFTTANALSKKGARIITSANGVWLTREIRFANGLVMRHVGNKMIISPPLVISKEEIDELASRAWMCLDLALDKAKREGLMVAR